MLKIANYVKITIKERKTNTEITILDTENVSNGMYNNKSVTGIPFVDVVDDSLDSFIFTLKDLPRRKPFKEFDLITYTIKTVEEDGVEVIDETKMFVLFDKVKSYSRERRTYEHTVSCVECTKALEKIKIFNLNLTNLNDTLLRQMQKACMNAEPIFEGKYFRYPRFYLSERLSSFLDGKPSRDFYFSNTDFRTVLDEILSVYNARIVVTDVYFREANSCNEYLLDYHSMDVVTDVTPKWTEEEQGCIIYEELGNNGQDYAGMVVARGYNSIAGEPIMVRDVLRSTSYTMNDQNMSIFLPFPISSRGVEFLGIEGQKVYKLAEEGVDNSDIPEMVKPGILDLTPRIIPQEQYDLMNETTSRGYIPYQIGSTSLGMSKIYKFWGVFTVDALEAIIRARIDDYIGEIWKMDEDDPDYMIYDKYVLCGFRTPFSIEESVFVVKYYPIIDTASHITKPGVYNREETILGIMDSQTEQMLDIERHGKKLAGLIKRTGNTEYYMDVKAKYFSKLLPVMSRIDLPNAEDEEEKNFILYKREYAIYDGFVNCRYYFSQNYNAVQENAGINRERHLFDIPLESSEAPIVTKIYLSFSFNKPENDADINMSFNSMFAYAAMRTLVGKNDAFAIDVDPVSYISGQIKYLLFQSIDFNGNMYPQNTEIEKSGETNIPYKDNENAKFILPVCGYSLDKTMNFMSKPLDNYSVGFARSDYSFSIWGDGGYRMRYNRYVSDAKKTVGEAERFVLWYAFDYPHQESNETSYGDIIENISYTPIRIPSSAPIIDESITPMYSAMKTGIEVHYCKDRTQTPLFVLSLECLPAEEDYGKIIIGTAFAKYNNLVRDNGTGLTGLYCYPSNKYTFNGDEDVLSKAYIANCPKHLVARYFTVEETSSGAVLKWNEVKAATIASGEYNATSWAIADEAGNIYLAVNGDLRDIYVCVKDWP